MLIDVLFLEVREEHEELFERLEYEICNTNELIHGIKAELLRTPNDKALLDSLKKCEFDKNEAFNELKNTLISKLKEKIILFIHNNLKNKAINSEKYRDMSISEEDGLINIEPNNLGTAMILYDAVIIEDPKATRYEDADNVYTFENNKFIITQKEIRPVHKEMIYKIN